MDRDEFLRKLDEKLSRVVQKEAAQEAERARIRNHAKSIVAEAVPLLKAYQAGLRERDIDATVEQSETEFSLSLHFADGGYAGLRFAMDREGTQYQLFNLGTDDNAKPYLVSLHGKLPHCDERWVLEDFETLVQATITDYVSSANRRGGFKIPS